MANDRIYGSFYRNTVDNFNNGVIDCSLKTYGSVPITAYEDDNGLTIVNQSLDSFDAYGYGPVTADRVYMYECCVSSISSFGSGNNFLVGLCTNPDANPGAGSGQQRYIVCYVRSGATPSSQNFIRLYYSNATGTYTQIRSVTLGAGVYPGWNGPNTAFKFRLYYNKRIIGGWSSEVYVPDNGLYLANNQVAAFYSINNGATWSNLPDAAWSFANYCTDPQPYEWAILARNTVANGGGTVTFRYLEQYYYDQDRDYLSTNPAVIDMNPNNGAVDVPRTASIIFNTSIAPHSTIDSYQNQIVPLTLTKVYVRDVLVYDGYTDTFDVNWSGSSYAYNGVDQDGYQFTLVPNAYAYYGDREVVTVRVLMTSNSGKYTNYSYSFTSTTTHTSTLNPTTDFTQSIVRGKMRKIWHPFRMTYAPYSARTYSLLSTGVRINLSTYFASSGSNYDDAAGRWAGFNGAGWGYAASTPIDVEVGVRDVSFTGTVSTLQRTGVMLVIPRPYVNSTGTNQANYVYMGVRNNSPNKQIILQKYYNGTLTDVFAITAPGGVITPARFRLVRNSAGKFDGYYNINSAGWNTIGSFTDSNFNRYMIPSTAVTRTSGTSAAAATFTDYTQNVGTIYPQTGDFIPGKDFEYYTGDGTLNSFAPKYHGPYTFYNFGYSWVNDSDIRITGQLPTTGQTGYLTWTDYYGSCPVNDNFSSYFMLYPGTNIEIIMTCRWDVTWAGTDTGGQLGFFVNNDSLDYSYNKGLMVWFNDNASSQRVPDYLVAYAGHNLNGTAFNSGTTYLSSFFDGSWGGTLIGSANVTTSRPVTRMLRMTRVGNVWSMYYGSSLSGPWTSLGSVIDSTGYTVNSPLTLKLYQGHYYDGLRRMLDVRVTQGDWVNEDDVVGPFVTGQSPADGETKVGLNKTISFIVLDESTGVRPQSIDAYVNNQLAFHNSVHVAPFDLDSYFHTVSYPAGDGYEIHIKYDGTFSEFSTITVRIGATDNEGNRTVTDYSFRTICTDKPRYNILSPTAGGTLARDGLVSLRIFDGYSGINLDSIDAYVDGYWAYKDGEFLIPFDGSNSSLVWDHGDGYVLTIDRAGLYDPNATVNIRVTVKTLDGY